MNKLFLLIISLLFYSCGDDFKKVEVLSEFRILSVVASTNNPEVLPGAVVNLQLFVSDVKGGGRTINGTTVACIDPGIAFGAKVNCDHDPSAVPGTYDIDTANDLDLRADNLFTGLASDVLNVTVPAGIFAGRSTTEQFNGVSYIVIFNFTVDGKAVSVFKRIVATNRGSLNTNPTGSAVFLNGVAIASAPAPAKDDKLKVTTSSPETYKFINAEGDTETRTEVFQVAWFITQGTFDKPKSDVDETVKYLGDAATIPSLVISIVRDDRGGAEIVREIFP
jgi:hypothetical protein